MGFHHFKSPRNKNWFAYLKKNMSYKQSSFFKIELWTWTKYTYFQIKINVSKNKIWREGFKRRLKR
jgi:uncharacterized protein YktB (UPF0637 family)